MPTVRENRVRWLKALVSGRYKQVRSKLEKVDRHTHKPIGYCCLGVACKIFSPELRKVSENFIVRYNGLFGQMPMETRKLVGIEYCLMNDLIYKNDCQNWSFEQIARFLARKWRIKNSEIGLKPKSSGK